MGKVRSQTQRTEPSGRTTRYSTSAVSPRRWRSRTGGHPLLVLGVDAVEEGAWLLVEAPAGAPPQRLIRRADVEHLGLVRVGHPEHIWMFSASCRKRSSDSSRTALSLFLLGDVDGYPADQRRRAVRPRDGEFADEGVVDDPILVHQRLDHLDARPTCQDSPVVLLERGGGLRREDFLVGLAVEFRPRRPKGFRGGVVGVDVTALQVLDPCQAGQVLHEPSKPLLAFTQRVLGPFPLSDVFMNADPVTLAADFEGRYPNERPARPGRLFSGGGTRRTNRPPLVTARRPRRRALRLLAAGRRSGRLRTRPPG